MLELYRERLAATPAAVPLARHGVGAALVQAGIADAALLADIALTVSEATTNAVRHAYPPGSDGHVDVTVSCSPSSIIVTVSDEGGGMNGALRDTGGLGVGLALMNSQTERLEIESDSAGTIVTLHFTAPAAESPQPP
jgi:two-component sensor histidine kinase